MFSKLVFWLIGQTNTLAGTKPTMNALVIVFVALLTTYLKATSLVQAIAHAAPVLAQARWRDVSHTQAAVHLVMKALPSTDTTERMVSVVEGHLLNSTMLVATTLLQEAAITMVEAVGSRHAKVGLFHTGGRAGPINRDINASNHGGNGGFSFRHNPLKWRVIM